MRNFLKKHEKKIVLFCGIMLGLILAGRWGSVYFRELKFIDAEIIVETARLIWNGILPYATPEYEALHFPAPPIQSPSISTMLLPFLWLPLQLLKIIIFLAGCTGMSFLFYLMVKTYKLYAGKSVWSCNYTNLGIWILALLLLLSSPILTCLRNGQFSIIVWVLTLMLFFMRVKDVSGVLILAGAAALKFTLLPVTAMLLWFQGRWKMCLAAFMLFLGTLFAPGLFLPQGIWGSFKAYLNMLDQDITGGFNSYGSGTAASMIQFDIFFNSGFNVAGKVFFISLLLIVLYWAFLRLPKEKRSITHLLPNLFSPAEWFLFTSVTLTLSYHRNHDGIIFLPFLFAFCAESLIRRRIIRSLIGIGFAFYWFIPWKVIWLISDKIGGYLPRLNEFIRYADTEPPYVHIFPLTNMVLALMVIFAFICVWNERRSVLKTKVSVDNGA